MEMEFKSIIQTISDIEERLGIRKLTEYTLFFMILYATFNFTSIISSIMDIQERIAKKEHLRKLRLRDELMDELLPILVELRTRAEAQRVLYFEYHNSTENFVGIPFKYANLVAVKQEYGTPRFDKEKYRDINSGLLGSMYSDLRHQGIILNSGPEFLEKYPEIGDFFSSQDGSVIQMFINLPGVEDPLGMIVLEWLEPIDEDVDMSELEDWIIRYCIPRINRLIDSKQQ